MQNMQKKYLNALTFKFYAFSRQNSETFDILHASLPLNCWKLSLSKKVFLAHPVYIPAVV